MSARHKRSLQLEKTSSRKGRRGQIIVEEEEPEDMEEEEDDDGEEDEEDSTESDSESDLAQGSKSRRRSRIKGRVPTVEELTKSVNDKTTSGALLKASKKLNARSGVTLTVDEMVQNCVYYFIINQHKKYPIKRADLIKNAMNGQRNNFTEVMAKLEGVLLDSFGMKIRGMEKTGKSESYSSYAIISEFYNDVAEAVTGRSTDYNTKRAILYLVLCVIFMLNRAIDEEMIWKIISDMNYHQRVCKKKEELGRFLKLEYVAPMYLHLEEIKDTDHVIIRYSWGIRAEIEFSKYKILNFVCKHFPKKRPLDFTIQFNAVLQTDDRDLADADLAAAEENPDGKNGSALSKRNNDDDLFRTPYPVDHRDKPSSSGVMRR